MKRILTLIALILSIVLVNTNIINIVNADSDYRIYYNTFTNDYIYDRIPTDKYYYNVDTNNNSNLTSDNIFSWSAGANVLNAVSVNTSNNDVYTLVFNLTLNNPNYENFRTSNSYGQYFLFDVYKSNSTSNFEKLFGIIYGSVSEYGTDKTIDFACIKQYSNKYLDKFLGIESIGIGGIDKNINTDDESNKVLATNYNVGDTDEEKRNNNIISTINDKIKGYLSDYQYYMVYYNSGADSIINLPFENNKLNLILKTTDISCNYFIRLEYGYYDENAEDTGYVSTSTIDTKIVSVYDICTQMKLANELSFFTDDMQEKIHGFDDNLLEKVHVAYLERVPNTPFAIKKYDYVTIPVVNKNISINDVINALGLSDLTVCQSACDGFVYDSDSDLYTAHYLKNVWLSSIDANGHSMNLFLDINKSYYNYFNPFVLDGIYTNEMYEWFLNTIYAEYPVLNGTDAKNIYGYFGYTSVPYTYTLNQLINDMFNGSPNMKGIVSYYAYRENLEYSAYIKLLNDYQYGWLAKSWNTVVGFVEGSKYPADHYFFYCDGEYDKAVISDNGSTDNKNGSLVNGLIKIGDNIGELFGSIFNGSEMFVKMISLILISVIPLWFVFFIIRNITKINRNRRK